MALVERNALISGISPPLDNKLAMLLVDEFVSMERRFIQRDWEPAELDGGQFAEILARILYHMDSGTLNYGKEHKECVAYLDDENNSRSHTLPRRDAKHLALVLKTIYKFRSERGAVHISPTYQANHMDSKFLIESVRWCMNETLRLFWQPDREKVARAIRELLQFDVPCIGVWENVIMVQRTDLNVDEEILVLLHYAGEAGMNRTQIGKHCRFAAPRVTEALGTLTSKECRQVVVVNGVHRLTDLGSRQIRVNLADKLLLQ